MFNRATTLSYLLVEEVHDALDTSRSTRPLRGLTKVAQRLCITGFVAFGTLIATLGKACYEVEVPGRDGVVHAFQKPWLFVLLMFLGMASALPVSLVLDAVRSMQLPTHMMQHMMEQRIPLLYEQDEHGHFHLSRHATAPPPPLPRSPPAWRQLGWLALPALCDLASSTLFNIGLLWITASTAQMLRGSLLLFASAATVLLLRKRLYRLHYAALALNCAGLAAVCVAALASGVGGALARPPRVRMAAGMGLVVASQALAAAQMLVDARLEPHLTLSPLKVLGCEGVLGGMLTLAVAAPLTGSILGREGPGLGEDWGDTVAQVANSRALQVMLPLQLVSLQGFNVCGMLLSASGTSLVPIQSVRTLAVWALGLAAPFTPLADLGAFGEPLTSWASLQAAGLAALLAASLMYSRGDGAHLRAQMESEAALVARERPPSRCSSMLSIGRWLACAETDVDSVVMARGTNGGSGSAPLPAPGARVGARIEGGAGGGRAAAAYVEEGESLTPGLLSRTLESPHGWGVTPPANPLAWGTPSSNAAG